MRFYRTINKKLLSEQGKENKTLSLLADAVTNLKDLI